MRQGLRSLLALYILCLGTASAAELGYVLQLGLLPGAPGWLLEGVATVTGRAPAAVDTLVFRFFQGINASVDLRTVREGEREIPWDSVDPTAIAVSLPLEEGQSFSVTFSYAIEVPPFPGGGYGTLAAGERTVVVSQAYPVLAPWRDGWIVEPVFAWGDALVAEVADYAAEIGAPPGWTVIATGTEEELPSGAVRVEGHDLREFAFVLVRNYGDTAMDAAGAEVRSWFSPPHRYAGERALLLAARALELCAALFGEYPFPELDVVEVPLRAAAGVEFPGLVLAGADYYRRRGELIFPMIFAHEVAHQWWYAQVGNDQVREPWVDEALATYTSGLIMEEWGLFPQLLNYWESSYERGRSGNSGATPFDPLWAFPEGDGYGGIVYSGGALFFLELEDVMGREQLLAALRRYLEEHRWKLASGGDLLRILLEEGGQAVEEVIRRWRGDLPP
ncbi:M1 family aminopeptidase [Candidatus Bipolaricaulota sp. J31]